MASGSGVEVERIARGPWGSNCYAVHDGHRALVVDPGGDAAEILRSLEERSLVLAGMVATHGHFDHVMAAAALTDATGYPLMVSAADEPMLAAGNLHSLVTGFGRPITRPPRVIDLDDRARPALPFDPVVMVTPGHTPGSRCLRVGPALFTGDTLLARGTADSHLPGADPEALARTLRVLGDLPEPDSVTLYPGHGEPCTLGEGLANAHRSP